MNPAFRPSRPPSALGALWPFRWITVLVTMALLISACGGDNDSDATGGGTGPDASGSPEAEVTTGAPSGPTGPTGSADPSVTPGTSSLSALPSYRYKVTLEGKGALAGAIGLDDITGEGETVDSFQYSIKGAWIAPDKAQLEMDFAGQAVKQTIIGNQQWLNVAGMAQGAIPADGKAEDLILEPGQTATL